MSSSIVLESPKKNSVTSPIKLQPPASASGTASGSVNYDTLKPSNQRKRLFLNSPTRSTSEIGLKNDNLLSSPNKQLTSPNKQLTSPNKRKYLQNMSPNVSNRTIYLNNSRPSGSGNVSLSDSFARSDTKEKNYIRPVSSSAASTSSNSRSAYPRPLLRTPISNLRSKSSISAFSRPKSSSSLLGNSSEPKIKLRRTNSLISQGGSTNTSDTQLQSSTTSSDRFIPFHRNPITGKLQTNNTNPHPNSSPQTHIKAQTSKIYQHHVAEACGLEVNSRILSYKPLPPERNKPISLFNNKRSNSGSGKDLIGSLRPAAASARAKKIPTAPERVLDAPGLVDDFYLNLLAWSSTNLLAIGLEDAIYVWNALTGSVGLLCELPEKTLVTSLKWSEDGSYISIGKDDGLIEIWDIETNTRLRTLNCENHQTRIAAQSWSQHILTSGSKLGNIYHSDVRIAQHVINKIEDVHQAEVCGIEYKSDGNQFATGGNDNLVCIWDARNSHGLQETNTKAQPLFTKTAHKAAVKALSWCPYQSSILATGGGTSDKTINFWNTSTGARVNTIETGSQISSLNWGYALGIGMEIVATHGYPTNSISLFNYPTLQKTGEINGAHDSRILSGCLSPDSLTLATVAGDENLKFWSLFDLYKQNRHGESGDRLDDDTNELLNNDESKKLKSLMNIR